MVSGVRASLRAQAAQAQAAGAQPPPPVPPETVRGLGWCGWLALWPGALLP